MNFEQIFQFLGGDDDSVSQPGVYPGVKSKDAVRNMIVDSNFDTAYDILSDKIEDPDLVNLILVFAVDVLDEKQLADIGIFNYSGVGINEVPPFLREFSTNSEWFEVPEPKEALDTLEKVIKYFGGDANSLRGKDLPEWAQKREDGLELRAALMYFKGRR